MGFGNQTTDELADRVDRHFEHASEQESESAWLEVMAIASLWLLSIAIGIYAFLALAG